MNDYEEKFEHLKERFNIILARSDYDALSAEIKQLEEESAVPGFWDEQAKAQKHMSKLGDLQSEKKELDEVNKKIQDLQDYMTLIDVEEDLDQKLNAEKEVEEMSENLEAQLDGMETRIYLNGKYDKNNAIVSLHSGQGGTEANDWTQILMRMYLRFFESKGWKAEVTHMVRGTETGFSSVTIEVYARYAYGLLKREHGTHRLVRISPFNAQGLRQTSFAGVEVMPIIENDDTEIVIKDEDIEFKAVRAGGPGGQKVNKTASAVQLRHLPTGIQVSASERKSQHQNREAAMNFSKQSFSQ